MAAIGRIGSMSKVTRLYLHCIEERRRDMLLREVYDCDIRVYPGV